MDNKSFKTWIDGMSIEELRKYVYGLFGRMIAAEQAQWSAERQLESLRQSSEQAAERDTQ